MYIGRYWTENTGTVWYSLVQNNIDRYLTGTILNINLYHFSTGMVRFDRYGTIFITMLYCLGYSNFIFLLKSKADRTLMTWLGGSYQPVRVKLRIQLYRGAVKMMDMQECGSSGGGGW